MESKSILLHGPEILLHELENFKLTIRNIEYQNENICLQSLDVVDNGNVMAMASI